jgi:hypothetical protein
MSRPHKLVVLGPKALVAVIALLLGASTALFLLGFAAPAGLLLSAVLTRLLPIARGRPGDQWFKVVKRGPGAVFRGQLGDGMPPPAADRPTPRERRRTPVRGVSRGEGDKGPPGGGQTPPGVP